MIRNLYLLLILSYLLLGPVNTVKANEKNDEKIIDPFNKDLSQLIAKRGSYSNGDYYPLESMLLVATLYSDEKNGDTVFKNTAILEMPDKSQIVVFEGQIIAKEKAFIETISKNVIVVTVNNKEIEIKISK
tara:strand:+ start:39 stop:431 length:393 start_codon:yes stop_codon:yes gene_type:complete